MAFINQAVTVLQTLVIALGAGLAVWGVVNLMEGYGNDNPGAKSQGIKQLMAVHNRKQIYKVSFRQFKFAGGKCQNCCVLMRMHRLALNLLP